MMEKTKLNRFIELLQKKTFSLRDRWANEKDPEKKEEMELTGLTLLALSEMAEFLKERMIVNDPLDVIPATPKGKIIDTKQPDEPVTYTKKGPGPTPMFDKKDEDEQIKSITLD